MELGTIKREYELKGEGYSSVVLRLFTSLILITLNFAEQVFHDDITSVSFSAGEAKSLIVTGCRITNGE